MKFYLLLLFISVSVCVVNAQQPVKPHTSAPHTKIKSKSNFYSYKIIESPNKTFGYEIYANKKLIIKQNTVPGRQGNVGFATKKQAEAVAKIVSRKLQNGIVPPTVTADELQKAGVK